MAVTPEAPHVEDPDALGASEAPRGPSAPASPLDELIQRREEIAADTETVIPVEHFGGLLAVHYQLIPWAETRKFGEQIERARGKNPKAELDAGAALIARATVGVLVPDPDFRRDPDAEPRPTDGWKSVDPSGETRRFDRPLAELFRIPPLPQSASSGDIVRLVFNRDYAVSAHAQELLEWMQGANGQVNRAFAEG